LTFATIQEAQAASRHDAFLDDGTITYKDLAHGTFEIVTRDGRVIVADDPGETIVVDPTGSVTRIPNTSSRMAELQLAQQGVHATLSLGQEGGAPGSSGNPISDQAPRDFQLAPQPINNVVVPGGINNENNTSLFKKEGFIFVPVCAENSDSNVLVMQPTDHGMRHDASDPLNRAGDWRIFVQ
jgi:hypothetical protein